MVAYGCQLCYYYRAYNDTNFFGFDLHNFNKNLHRTIEFAFKSVYFMYLALYTSRETDGTRRPAHWVNFVSERVNGISGLGGMIPGARGGIDAPELNNMQLETADFASGTATWCIDETYAMYSPVAHSLYYVKKDRHPQNQKCITYRIAVRGGPSDSHR